MASFNHIDWCESFGPYPASDCSCPCPCEWDEPCGKHDVPEIVKDATRWFIDFYREALEKLG